MGEVFEVLKLYPPSPQEPSGVLESFDALTSGPPPDMFFNTTKKTHHQEDKIPTFSLELKLG